MRCEPRLPLGEPLRVTVQVSPERQDSAHILDISQHGMRLRVDQPLPPGTTVLVEWDGYALSGQVRYCKRDGQQYALGLRLQVSVNIEELTSIVLQRAEPAGRPHRP